MTDQPFLTEIPSSMKQLARLSVRGFYSIEDSLIVDMLVRNPCMREDDICELLRFDRKQMRARLTVLKNEKFLQGRLKMETGPDGKAAKVTYYFINYNKIVNVFKYKLDWMRKRLETTERDATSRASFKCTNCNKTFTDLEADQLFDFTTSEFRCTFCGSLVEEDNSALPKKDSRLMLIRFNEVFQTLYDLLREVEDIKLSPECCEPEPVDIDTIRGMKKPSNRGANSNGNEQWSGEATRNQGLLAEETRIDVTIDAANQVDTQKTKDRPVWMTESTIVANENTNDGADMILNKAAQNSTTSSASTTTSSVTRGRKENEDIMSVLLQHEKQPGKTNSPANALKGLSTSGNSSDSSEDEREIENTEIRKLNTPLELETKAPAEQLINGKFILD